MSSEKYEFTRRHIAQNGNINPIRDTSRAKIQLHFLSENIILFTAENLKCFLLVLV